VLQSIKPCLFVELSLPVIPTEDRKVRSAPGSQVAASSWELVLILGGEDYGRV
jgi:hypothetical protein